MSIKEIKSQFTLGHITAIGIAVLVVGGVLTLQNWNSVKAMFEKEDVETAQQEGSGLYYAYEAPTVPTVLGADTEPDGPGVINEDGSITSLSSLGSVLGASSDVAEINVDTIKVNSYSGNEQNLKEYIDESFLIESKILPGDFETALVSNDESQVNAQVSLLEQVQDSLYYMKVPEAAVKLHRLKIAQYSSAIDLLKNYYQADSNPEFVSAKLSQFMDMQRLQETETQNIFNQHPGL